MTPNSANEVTCSVVGHTFGSLVDDRGRRLCIECGTPETPAPDDDGEPDADPTDLYTEPNGGEGG